MGGWGAKADLALADLLLLLLLVLSFSSSLVTKKEEEVRDFTKN